MTSEGRRVGLGPVGLPELVVPELPGLVVAGKQGGERCSAGEDSPRARSGPQEGLQPHPRTRLGQ